MSLIGMKGVILAGGEGTRLRPLTIAINKHLLRIGKLPMIEYPLRTLIEAGIDNIHIVTGGENYQGVVKYLGSGSRYNVRITYSIQDEAGGIAQALSLAEPFVGEDKCLVLLGDNIFSDSLKGYVEEFKKDEKGSRAFLFSKESKNPQRFGVLLFKNDKIADIIEKPKDPPSNKIVTGIYMYTPDVFEIIKTLKPSLRNEYEITDVNRLYIKFGNAVVYSLVGDWTDAGTFETLMNAECQVKEEDKYVENTFGSKN